MISTKGRYALRVMLDLAEHADGGATPLKAIAERQEISKKYLEIIVRDLVKAGLIRGSSGKGGGYTLCRAAEEYTVGEILALTEGTLAAVACLAEGADGGRHVLRWAAYLGGHSSRPLDGCRKLGRFSVGDDFALVYDYHPVADRLHLRKDMGA